MVRARNIVEAFNLDPQTPPEYIVMTEDEEDEEELSSLGFQIKEKASKKKNEG